MSKDNKQLDLEDGIKDAEAKGDVTRVNLKNKVKKEDNIYKVDMSKKPAEETNDDPAVEPEPTKDDKADDKTKKEVEGVVAEEPKEESVKVDLPSGVDSLIEFIKETGGSMEDYMRLNRDVDAMDGADLLDEYYKHNKPHLSVQEREFLMEEEFGYDPDVDDDREIQKKKIARKEAEVKAKDLLKSRKEKFYKEVKSEDGLSVEQREAMDFFNRYKKESQQQKQQADKAAEAFRQRTEEVFKEGFEGFEFKVGDKSFMYEVKDADRVKENQSSIDKFVGKFVGDDKTIDDATGYHKALFTAMNPDAIARHFYEQGKADAIKETVARTKNVSSSARQAPKDGETSGIRYKVLGQSADDFKIRRRKK